MESTSKRKRDLDCPRITFHASDRTFDRLFREDSLEQLQEVVRRKLGLQSSATVKLAQIRGTTDVDLEDDDDFDAFYSAVHSTFTANIRVTIQSDTTAKGSRNDEFAVAPPLKKRKLNTPQASAPRPLTSPTDATRVSVLSDKRAASPSSEAAGDASEPPSKRVRISSPHPPAKPVEKRTSQVHESKDKSDATTKGKSVPETGLGSPPAPNSSAAVEKIGTDAKKSAKLKSKKGLDHISSSLGVKTRDEVLAEQAKAERELKKKEKSLKKERKKAGESSTASGSTKGGDGLRDATSKSKKSSTQSEAPTMVVSDSGKKKKAVKSKALVQEATSDSVDSESNDVLDVNTDSEEALANASRSIIEKYLSPKPSTAEVGSKDSVSVVRNTPTTPTCPYCGRSLTHDRSHCPLLRSKFILAIEQRLEEVKANEGGGLESQANAISALQAALQRRRSALANQEQSITVSRTSTSHPKPSSPSIVSTSTHNNEPSSRSESSTSSDSPSEGGAMDEDSSPKNGSISRISVQQEPTSGRTASTSHLLVPLPPHDTDTEDSSDSDAPLSEPSIRPKSIPFRPLHGDDSESSSSSEAESEDVAASHSRGLLLSRPVPRSTLPSKDDGVGYNDQDLEALIRGPGVPLKSTDLPSSESSEDEKPEDVQLHNESEQESEGRSKKTAPPFAMDSDSPDDDVEGDDENEKEFPHNSLVNPIPPPVVASQVPSGTIPDPTPEASQENRPFQQINRRTRSEVMDRSGNDAFEDVLALENTPLGLVRKELILPPTVQKPSAPPATSHLRQQSHDQLEKQLEEPEEERTSNTNGTTPLAVMQEDPEREQPSAPPDLVGSTDTSDVVPDAERKNAVEAIESVSGPSTPPPHTQETQPREEPARASTPKPAMIQRMKNRTGRAPLTRKQANPLSLNQTPVAKPSTRKNTLRAQSKSTNKNSTNESYQNNDDADAETETPKVNAIPKKGAASATKTSSIRTTTTAERKLNGVEEDKEPDPPPRRSQRTSSKPVSVAPEVIHANLQPLTRKTRTTSIAPNNKEVMEPPQPQPSSKKPTRAVKKSKKAEANVTVNSSFPILETENSDTVVSGSQAGGSKTLCPPSPPVSLNHWEALETETPMGTTQSDPMVDELHSDMDPIPFSLKPQHQRKSSSFGPKESFPRLGRPSQDKGDPGNKETDSPLFIPSESQTAFPHSQFQTDTQEYDDDKSSDSEEEVLAAVANKAPRSESLPSTYRALSVLASHAVKLFTPKASRQTPSFSQNSSKRPSTRKDRLDQLYGRMGRNNSDDIESDDGSGQDSDSDASKTSHIPKSRKAGAAAKGRKSVA